MFLHYFKKKETEDKIIAKLVYLKIIKIVNSIILNNTKFLKKDINTIFEITSLLLISLFYGSKLKRNKNNFSILQELMDLFTKDLDYSFRHKGISDINIGKYVKLHLKKFYYRVSKYEKIFNHSDKYSFNLFINNLKIFNNEDNKETVINLLYVVSNKLIKESEKRIITKDFLLSFSI